MGGPRDDLAYPRATEHALLAAGRPATVRDTSLGGELTKTALRRWEPEVLQWSPDVIVLHYGQVETIHLFVPQRLERHANSWRTRPGKVRALYRMGVLRPVWKSLTVTQRRLDGRVIPATFRNRAERVADDLERLVERTQLAQSPLVLIMQLVEPAQRWKDWFPGITERTSAMNAALAEVVQRVGRDNVRLFDVPGALSQLKADGVPVHPDGGHFSPAAHAAIASVLAREILTWAEDQPHLQASAGIAED